jgi:hypothetical protein
VAGNDVYRVRAKAIRECADRLAAELRGPWPTALREAGQRAHGYLRSYAADCLVLDERTALARDLADSLREALMQADRPHGALRQAQLAGARRVLLRAERELKHVR